jgi:hypothetical protein
LRGQLRQAIASLLSGQSFDPGELGAHGTDPIRREAV